MTKEEIFDSLKNLKKPVIVHMYKNLYEDREELLEKHQMVLKNWGNKIKELEEENAKLQEELKNVIITPKNFDVGQIVYMIPTEWNALKTITAYTILSFAKSDIGCRACLSILKKEKGFSPYFYASFEMFNTIIFATEAEAQKFIGDRQ